MFFNYQQKGATLWVDRDALTSDTWSILKSRHFEEDDFLQGASKQRFGVERCPKRKVQQKERTLLQHREIITVIRLSFPINFRMNEGISTNEPKWPDRNLSAGWCWPSRECSNERGTPLYLPPLQNNGRMAFSFNQGLDYYFITIIAHKLSFLPWG